MQISDTQVKKILEMGSLAQQIDLVGDARRHAEDQRLVADVVADVNAMDDREDRIADLKARIEAGSYNPAGAEIVDAMIRRAAADSVSG